MKALKISLALVALLASAATIQAQSLHIVYDFIKDDVKYYRTKPGDMSRKEISSPVVGRNKLVTVEVINFNKFVYAAGATYESKVVEKQTDMGFLDIVSPLVNPLGSTSFFSALGGTLPTEIGRGGVLSTRGASTAYDDILNAYNELTDIENDLKAIDYAITKMNKLKYNPYLPTDTIVSMTSNMVRQIFNKPVMNPSDFSEVIVNYNKNYTESMASLKTSTVAFLSEYNDYASRNSTFEGQGLDQAVRNFNLQVDKVAAKFDGGYITDQIDYLETVYTSIILTQFSFNSSHAAKDDEIDLTLSFYKIPKDENGNYTTVDHGNLEALNKVKDKKISISVNGDVKVTTSIGLAFPKFTTTDEFIYRDSMISTIPGSSFSPNLTAFINVYPYSSRTLHLGGSFGIGVPVQEEQKNVNMFMSFSALFGADSRVGLHAGASLGQVKKLAHGYEVGDALLPSDIVVPTRNVWEWGGFVGISFNIAKAGY